MAGRIIGDMVNNIANDLSQDHNISRCEAVAIVAELLLSDELPRGVVNLSEEDKKTLENTVLASCLGNNDYMFR